MTMALLGPSGADSKPTTASSKAVAGEQGAEGLDFPVVMTGGE